MVDTRKMHVTGNQGSFLDKATELISETMGEPTGKLFHKFYEFDNNEEILVASRSLLSELMGPEVTEKKIQEIRGES